MKGAVTPIPLLENRGWLNLERSFLSSLWVAASLRNFFNCKKTLSLHPL
jgi:hypothetical protein